MHKYRFTLLALLLVADGCLLFSCSTAPPKQLRPAFYYWRSVYRPDSLERSYLTGTPAPWLYIRFFDVVWDPGSGQPVPAAPLRFEAEPDSSLHYIPVVFITLETLEKITPDGMAGLAAQILKMIASLSKPFGHGYPEVQIDCDWTQGTRDRYFLLLDDILQTLHSRGIRLSVTLRLHQIKYLHRTGVPPADRGMLMFYNMGDWKSPGTRNSLYDLRQGMTYLSRMGDYPLPLDIALPLVRWTIVYRNGTFLTFLNHVAGDDCLRASFLSPLGDGQRFRVNRDTFAFGCGFRRNDLLRCETAGFRELMEGKKQLLRRIRNPRVTIALFHLDKTLLKHDTHEQIQEIFSPVQ